MESFYFNILVLCLVVTGLLLNILAFYLLYTSQSKGKNQKTLLLYLTSSSILIGITDTVCWCCIIYGLNDNESRTLQCLFIIDDGVYTIYYLTLEVVTLDRLFALSIHSYINEK